MGTDEAPTTVWICPACGARYDTATVCSNQHEPTETQQYELDEPADVEAAEGAPAATVEAAAAETAAAEGAAKPTAEKPTPETAPEPTPVKETGLRDALAAFDAAYADLKTKLGL